MVNLLFADDKAVLTKPGILKTIYDPACGTGGMLSVAEDYVQEFNSDAKLELFGQEINPESYAICKSDMLIKGHKTENIKFGNTLTQDGLADVQFDYMLSNPRLVWTGRRSKRRSATNMPIRDGAGGLVPGCRRLVTGRCCSCST